MEEKKFLKKITRRHEEGEFLFQTCPTSSLNSEAQVLRLGTVAAYLLTAQGHLENSWDTNSELEATDSPSQCLQMPASKPLMQETWALLYGPLLSVRTLLTEKSISKYLSKFLFIFKSKHFSNSNIAYLNQKYSNLSERV